MIASVFHGTLNPITSFSKQALLADPVLESQGYQGFGSVGSGFGVGGSISMGVVLRKSRCLSLVS